MAFFFSFFFCIFSAMICRQRSLGVSPAMAKKIETSTPDMCLFYLVLSIVVVVVREKKKEG
jgi:hypothetical protein